MPRKIQASTSIQTPTSAIPVQCSTSWAIRAKWELIIMWVHANLFFFFEEDLHHQTRVAITGTKFVTLSALEKCQNQNDGKLGINNLKEQ